MPTPYYLTPKRTKLPAGHDDTLDPSEEPTDAAQRGVPPTDWPQHDTSPGPRGPRDRPAGHRPTDPARRALAPFEWPRFANLVGLPEPDLDPDIALWPVDIVNRWPFTGPPTTGVWPLGWMGIDNTAAIWVCVVGGAPGSWQQITPAPPGFVTPDQFGAVGDGVTDDTVPVQAAFSASNQVYIPAKTYAVSSRIVPKATTGYYGGVLQGAGRNSILKWTNLGNPATCERAGEDIAIDSPAGLVVRDVTLQGPANVNPGQNNACYISGLTVPIDGLVDNVLIMGFHSGLVFKGGNHSVLRRVRCNYNFYGAIWPDYAGGGVGNIIIELCHWVSNALAGWKFGATQNLNNSEVIDCDWSSNPWAILFTDTWSGWDVNNNPIYAGAGPNQTPIQGTWFRNMDCEGMGNGVFLDISKFCVPAGSGGKGQLWDAYLCKFDLIGISLNAANAWTNATGPLPAANLNQNWMFVWAPRLCMLDYSYFTTYGIQPNMMPVISTVVGLYMDIVIYNLPPTLLWTAPQTSAQIMPKLFTQNRDGSTWPPYPPLNQTVLGPRFLSADGARRGTLETTDAAAPAITAGQLLQYNAAQRVVPAANANSIAGIALGPSAGAGAPVFIAKQGLVGDTTKMVTTTGAVSMMTVCTSDTTTFTNAKAFVPGTSMQAIGIARSAAAANATFTLDLFSLST